MRDQYTHCAEIAALAPPSAFAPILPRYLRHMMKQRIIMKRIQLATRSEKGAEARQPRETYAVSIKRANGSAANWTKAGAAILTNSMSILCLVLFIRVKESKTGRRFPSEAKRQCCLHTTGLDRPRARARAGGHGLVGPELLNHAVRMSCTRLFCLSTNFGRQALIGMGG